MLTPQEPLLPELPQEAKQRLEQIKDKVEKFQKIVLKEHKEILGLSLLPPSKPLPGERLTKEQEEQLAKGINILVLIDLGDIKDFYIKRDGVIRSCQKIAKEIDKDLVPNVIDLWELKEACFDAKYEIAETIAVGATLYDPKEILAALRISMLHKNMTLKKFEKYIVSYVLAGSLFRGDKVAHDIDVYLIVDDTDVKKMTRAELKDKLSGIIRQMGFDAADITGVKKQFHIQTYILTDFWESVKDAHPVIYTFLRDGVPIYDRAVFMAWKLLLMQGRIRPSPEAIDYQMDMGDKLIKRTKNKMLSIVGEDLFYAILNPAQAALMLYGMAPPTPRETIKLMDEIFVKKEKLLEKKYVDILEKIFKYYKDIEHYKINDVTGKEIDQLLNNAEDYLERLRKLFDQIQKKRDKELVAEMYKNCVTVTEDVLKSEGIKIQNVTTGAGKLAEKNIINAKLVETLKEVIKLKQTYATKKISHNELDKINRDAKIYFKTLTEHLQLKGVKELEKVRVRFKYGDHFGDVLLFEKIAFISTDVDGAREIQKAVIEKDGSLTHIEKCSYEEFEKAIANIKVPKNAFIKEKIFEDLRKLFGKDVEIMI